MAGLLDMRAGKASERTVEHGADVHAVVLSPDGKVLATSGRDGTIKLWDVRSERLLRTIKGHVAGVRGLAFSPDGKLLASGSGDPLQVGNKLEDRALRLWDAATGRELASLGRHALGITGVRFSPDGKVLYAATHMSIQRWDVAARKEIEAGAGHQGWVGAIAFSPDGKTIATGGSDRAVRLWDRVTAKERQVIVGCEAPVHSLAYAPDGKLLAAGSMNGQLLLWGASSGKEVARFQVGRDRSEVVAAFSPDGKHLVAGSRDGAVVLWNARALREVWCVPQSKQEVMSLAFSPNSKQLILGCQAEGKDVQDDLVRLWDVTSGKEVRRFVGLPALMVTSVGFSPDGRLLAATCWGLGHKVQFWDVRTGRALPSVGGGRGGARKVAFSPDGRMLAAIASDGAASLREVATGKERKRYEGHVGTGTAVAFALDGKTFASGGTDSTVLLWNVRGMAGKRDRSSRELAQCWDALAGTDAVGAFEAVLALAAAGRPGAQFLAGRLRPAAIPDKKIKQLLADLDSDDFAVRERATAGLIALGKAGGPSLLRFLRGKPALEARRRAERILQKVVAEPLSAEELRELRAVEALEHSGTREAIRLLETLSLGASDARLTREARAALERQNGRRSWGWREP